MHVVDQVMIIYAATKGFMDDVPIKQVRNWEEQFLTFMREQKAAVRDDLKAAKKLTPENEGKLKAAIDEFRPQFQTK
jgi:F-type H+-transporting ATPase subunit alpha